MVDTWDWPAIGIELGERYASVGIWQQGQVEIIMNDQGNRKIPYCVAFTQKECLIGDAAKNQIATNPENTIFDVNKLIGKRYGAATFQNDIKNCPFKVMAGANNDKPKIAVSYLGEERQFTPEEIFSMVLMKLKQTAEAYLCVNVKHAVIAVPCYSSASRRQSTRDAAVMAGLSTIEIISEPRAAAVAYAFHKKFALNRLDNYVLIFNLDGRSLDISLITVGGGVIKYKGVNGHYELGGDDFDKRIATNFIEEFRRSRGQSSLFDNPKFHEKLVAACERAKRRLSIEAETELSFDFQGNQFSADITRTTFEILNEDLFKKCVCIVEHSLGASEMRKSDINYVILVGGSTRIPMVRQMLREVLPEAELCFGIKVNEVYAYGATIHAAMLSGVNMSPVIVPCSKLHRGATSEESLLPCKKRRRPLQTSVQEFSPSIILQDIDSLLKELSNAKVLKNEFKCFSFPKDQLLMALEEIRRNPNDLLPTWKLSGLLENLYPLLPKHFMGNVKSLEQNLLDSQRKFMEWSCKEVAIPLKLEDAGKIQCKLIEVKTQFMQKTYNREHLKSNIAEIDKEIAKLVGRKSQLKKDLKFTEQELLKLSYSMGPQLDLAKQQSAQVAQLRQAKSFKAEAKISMESTLNILANNFMKF